MTALKTLLTERIAATGPITLAEYMTECLLHPDHGYYTGTIPFGADGDFTTAPEISQMFGELLGLWLAQCWLDRGAPAPFCLAELGPGRGTMMADIWRATAQVPGFHAAARMHLVEASPALRATQASTLPTGVPKWCDTIEDLPPMPTFLLANEFFDALPVRTFSRTDTGWAEHQIGLNDGALTRGLAPSSARPELAYREAGCTPGDIVETCPAAHALMGTLSDHIATHSGVALIIDYGDWRALGDTLQAVQNHQSVDVFDAPGQADLTAHVDFEALVRACRHCAVSPMVPQGVFLERLGITARALALAGKLTGDALEEHIAAHRRLTHPEEMGTLFKILGLSDPGSPPLPGLQPWP